MRPREGGRDGCHRCREYVYVRDTYRYTGRTKSGFELHYTRKRCSRKAGADGYCWQHRAGHNADYRNCEGAAQ